MLIIKPVRPIMLPRWLTNLAPRRSKFIIFYREILRFPKIGETWITNALWKHLGLPALIVLMNLDPIVVILHLGGISTWNCLKGVLVFNSWKAVPKFTCKERLNSLFWIKIYMMKAMGKINQIIILKMLKNKMKKNKMNLFLSILSFWSKSMWNQANLT